jgi:hypothetical protein
MSDEELIKVAKDVLVICETSFRNYSGHGRGVIAGMLQPWAAREDVAKAISLCSADTVSPRFCYPHIASIMEDIIRKLEPPTVDGPVVHLAGVFVGFAGRVIQRCAVCGFKLVDNKNTASPDGGPMPTWANGRLIEVHGGRSIDIGDFEKIDVVPQTFCIALVE